MSDKKNAAPVSAETENTAAAAPVTASAAEVLAALSDEELALILASRHYAAQVPDSEKVANLQANIAAWEEEVAVLRAKLSEAKRNLARISGESNRVEKKASAILRVATGASVPRKSMATIRTNADLFTLARDGKDIEPSSHLNTPSRLAFDLFGTGGAGMGGLDAAAEKVTGKGLGESLAALLPGETLEVTVKATAHEGKPTRLVWTRKAESTTTENTAE